MEQLREQLRRHVVGAWRYRWAAVAVAWLICAAGWVGVANIPNSYEANARIYIDADAVLTPLLRGIALNTSLESQIDVLRRTLLSRPNLETLISKTSLDLTLRGPSDRERLVAELGTAIHIVPQTQTLFTISYSNKTPQTAFDVVSTILNIFVESKIGSNRSDMENASRFLDQQIAGYEAQLRDAESKRAAFRAKYIDLLPNDVGNTRLDTARANVRALEGQLADATAHGRRLAEALATTPPTIVTETDPGAAAGPGGSGGSSELAAAEQHLRELLINDTDQHPEVVRQRRLIADLRSSGKSSAGSAAGTPARPARSKSQPNPVFEQLTLLKVQSDSDEASLRRQVADATRERDRLEEIARSAPGVQAQFINLDRDYDVVRKNYDELIARREAMRLSAAADSHADKVKLQVIDPPMVPRIPVGPKRILLMSGVLLAGLGGGIAAAVLLGQFDRSFHSLRDLRSFGLPVAGGISMMDVLDHRQSRLNLSVAVVAMSLLLLVGVYGGLLYRVIQAGPT
jgi:polysaccharide chain length determinant protein (PEP-CTERM system associated)